MFRAVCVAFTSSLRELIVLCLAPGHAAESDLGAAIRVSEEASKRPGELNAPSTFVQLDLTRLPLFFRLLQCLFQASVPPRVERSEHVDEALDEFRRLPREGRQVLRGSGVAFLGREQRVVPRDHYLERVRHAEQGQAMYTDRFCSGFAFALCPRFRRMQVAHAGQDRL